MKKKVSASKLSALKKKGARVISKAPPEQASTPAPVEVPERVKPDEMADAINKLSDTLLHTTQVQSQQTMAAIQQGQAAVTQSTEAINALSTNLEKSLGSRVMIVERDQRDLITSIKISEVS